MELSYLAILVAAVINMVIGAIWYSPRLFGDTFLKLSKLSKKDVEKANMSAAYGGDFIGSLLMAYAIAMIVMYMNVDSYTSAIGLGFLLWLGFSVPLTLSFFSWDQRRPMGLFWIYNGFRLMGMVAMTCILFAWT